jgi:hypothetical protein
MCKKIRNLLFVFFVAVLPFFIVGGCNSSGGGGGGGACPQTNIGIEVCDPGAGPFSPIIDNGFFPVVAGSESLLEDEGGQHQLAISVPGEIEPVAGVNTRVLVEMESEGGKLIEVSRNFFAQVAEVGEGAGTVCYFGEDVNICEAGLEQDGNGGFLCEGQEPSHEGSWRAGENGALSGIIMLPDPMVNDSYKQEDAPGVAEDHAEVMALGEPIEVPAGNFDDTLRNEDCNPFDGTTDLKVYVNGIGLAIDEDLELVESSLIP